MATDALAPFINRILAALVLAITDKQVIVF